MKQIAKVTCLLLILHSLLLVFIVTSILNNNESDWPMYWLMLFPIDLPAYAIGYLLAPVLETALETLASQFSSSSPLGDPLNFWYPAFTFGLLGTIQWVFLPKIAMYIYKRTKAKTANKSFERDQA